MKKICLRCAGFLLILAFFLGILSAVFYPKGRGYNDGLENPRIWAFQAEPENSLEVLAIGDSLLMCGYSPLDVWTQRGYTGFGCCTGNQRLTQSLRMLSGIPTVGVTGIWWSVPIGWGLADLVGFLYYKAKKKELLEL